MQVDVDVDPPLESARGHAARQNRTENGKKRERRNIFDTEPGRLQRGGDIPVEGGDEGWSRVPSSNENLSILSNNET